MVRDAVILHSNTYLFSLISLEQERARIVEVLEMAMINGTLPMNFLRFSQLPRPLC